MAKYLLTKMAWATLPAAVAVFTPVVPPALSASAETVSETQHALELSPLAESYHGVKPNLVTPVPSDGHVYAS